MMKPQLVPRLRRDARGSVTIVFGLAVTVLALVVALAIDTARAFDIKSRVQAALDAAALASAKLLDVEGLTDAEIKTRAEDYFQEQLTRLAIVDLRLNNFEAELDRTANSVAASVDVSLQSIFGSLANIGNRLEFSPESSATFQAMKVELALVADITGSMCDVAPLAGAPPCASAVKLDALKAAIHETIQALFESNPAVGAIRVALVPYSASVNAGVYAAAASGGASSDGCVVERSGADAFTNAGPQGRPVGAIAPGSLPFYSCVASRVRPLADLASPVERATFLNAVDNLAASGGTAGHIGAAWGWYVLSPEWGGVFGGRAGRPWDPARVIKAVILMTDGQFNISYANGGETNPWPDPLSSDASHPGSSGYQALQLCDAIRSDGDPSRSVRIYTVAFQAPLAAEELLKQCSGEENYYDAANASQLGDAFRDIVRRLNSLRVTS